MSWSGSFPTAGSSHAVPAFSVAKDWGTPGIAASVPQRLVKRVGLVSGKGGGEGGEGTNCDAAVADDGDDYFGCEGQIAERLSDKGRSTDDIESCHAKQSTCKMISPV
jgi:hypothetical protein